MFGVGVGSASRVKGTVSCPQALSDWYYLMLKVLYRDAVFVSARFVHAAVRSLTRKQAVDAEFGLGFRIQDSGCGSVRCSLFAEYFSLA